MSETTEQETRKAKRYWQELFNNLPHENRKIIAVQEITLRIQHLEFEKRRLKQAYEKSVADINSHIKNLESDLRSEARKDKQLQSDSPIPITIEKLALDQSLNDSDKFCPDCGGIMKGPHPLGYWCGDCPQWVNEYDPRIQATQ